MIIRSLLIVIVSSTALLGQRGYETIVPLQSDRGEVEKVLGRASSDGCVTCTYETPTNRVEVRYATGPCEGALPGWNVPKDTVLSFTVEPKVRETVDPKKFEVNGFTHFSSDDFTRYYVDAINGLKYTISRQSELKSVTHLPLNSNNALRCDGFPRYEVVGATYRPFETFRDVDDDTGVAYFNSSLVTLRRSGFDVKLYAVVYAGDNLTGKAFKDYLVKIRQALKAEFASSRPLLEIISGGRKKHFQVELFFVKRDNPPPCPLPELPG